MDISSKIIHEYKVERVPASIISNITTALIFASFVLVPLMVIILSSNKILGVIVGIVIFNILVVINRYVYPYISFFVGMPFMIVSLLNSVDFRDYKFKDFANRMVDNLYENGEIDIICYKRTLDDISRDAWVDDEE